MSSIMHCGLLSGCFQIMFSRLILVVWPISTSFLFIVKIIFHCVDRHFVYSFLCWWSFELCPLFGCYEKCCQYFCTSFCMNMFSNFLGIYLVQLLGYMLTLMFNLLRDFQAVFHSNCAILRTHQQQARYSPQFLHILDNICYFQYFSYYSHSGVFKVVLVSDFLLMLFSGEPLLILPHPPLLSFKKCVLFLSF